MESALIQALINAFAISIAMPIIFVPLLASGTGAKKRDYYHLFLVTAFLFVIVFVLSLIAAIISAI